MIKEGIHINGIYKHYKGSLYKVLDVAFHHEDQDLKFAVVIYSRCDIDGLYKSIRERATIELETTNFNEKYESKEIIVKQPFYRPYHEFISNIQGGYPNNPTIPRFKFIKQL